MTENFFGFIFDSGAKGYNVPYFFEIILSSMKDFEISNLIGFYYGDVTDSCNRIDIDRFINRNEMCTVQGKPNFKDWPYFICLYGISREQRDVIEASFKNIECYIGSTNIEIETKIKTKKIWKSLYKNIRVNRNDVFFENYGEEQNCFEYLFKKYNYKINYVPIFETKIFEIEDEDDSQKKEFNLIQNTYKAGIRLNVEVRVAGGLIWDSIEKLSNVSYFPKYLDKNSEPNNTEDCYMCIYNASQGIERLQKSLIELIICKENCQLEEEENTYKLLMSHNHELLHNFIKNKAHIKNNEKYNKLVSDLSKFYNYIRYNNYDADSEFNRTYFYDILCSYANVIKDKDSVSVEKLDSFELNFASALGDYASLLYETIDTICAELNIFAYELDYTHKSSLVFSKKKSENLYKIFLQFKMAKKEVLYYLAINGKDIFANFLDIKPLDFDQALINNYCESIIENDGFDYYDFFDESYDLLCKDNKEEFKTRESFINFIFSRDFEWSQLDEDDD